MRIRSWRVGSLLRNPDAAVLARRAGDRLLTLVAGLAPRDAVELALASSGDGQVRITTTVTSAVPDLPELLAWVWEDVAALEAVAPVTRRRTLPERCVELVPAIRFGRPNMWTELADQDMPQPVAPDRRTEVWPTAYLTSSMELLRALRSVRAEVRVHFAPASDAAAQMVTHEARLSTLAKDADVFDRYVGEPVAARLFVGHDGPLSPRVRGALLGRGGGLMLRPLDLEVADHRNAWAGEADSLLVAALPFGAAQCFTVIPAPGSKAEICGVPTVEAPTQPVPLADDACEAGLRLGAAVSANEVVRDVRIAVDELLLHTQVIGSTGTGKSSLLAGLVHEAQTAGVGVSVIDAHGHLVQRILGETPVGRVGSVVAVRHGDPDRPVPVNPFAGRNPELITDVMVEVLRQLHDPGNQGFLGPVWERWLGSFMALQRALIGPRANLALLPDMAVEQKRLANLVSEAMELHPQAAREMSNVISRRPEEYAESATWFVAKFQRMVNSPELRGILGSGRDTVDVADVVDRHQVLLIDLAAPVLGDLGAQLVGEMWLAKHWEALAQRVQPGRPHLLIVDEAHLFASGLLPRLLTQARKFGVAVVLAHQNLEQLTSGLREAVLASTNNVVVFRTGLQEAMAAHQRLGSWSGGPLTRLPRLTAAATLSTGVGLTDAFTLRVDHNDRAPAPAQDRVAEIVEHTKTTFGVADATPLTFASLREAVDRQRADQRAKREQQRFASRLDDWLSAKEGQRADSAGK